MTEPLTLEELHLVSDALNHYRGFLSLDVDAPIFNELEVVGGKVQQMTEALLADRAQRVLKYLEDKPYSSFAEAIDTIECILRNGY